MYLCMVITYSRVRINRVRLPILLVVSSIDRSFITKISLALHGLLIFFVSSLRKRAEKIKNKTMYRQYVCMGGVMLWCFKV